MKKYFFFLPILVLVFSSTSCKKGDESEKEEVSKIVDTLFEGKYLRVHDMELEVIEFTKDKNGSVNIEVIEAPERLTIQNIHVKDTALPKPMCFHHFWLDSIGTLQYYEFSGKAYFGFTKNDSTKGIGAQTIDYCKVEPSKIGYTASLGPKGTSEPLLVWRSQGRENLNWDIKISDSMNYAACKTLKKAFDTLGVPHAYELYSKISLYSKTK